MGLSNLDGRYLVKVYVRIGQGIGKGIRTQRKVNIQDTVVDGIGLHSVELGGVSLIFRCIDGRYMLEVYVLRRNR